MYVLCAFVILNKDYLLTYLLSRKYAGSLQKISVELFSDEVQHQKSSDHRIYSWDRESPPDQESVQNSTNSERRNFSDHRLAEHGAPPDQQSFQNATILEHFGCPEITRSILMGLEDFGRLGAIPKLEHLKTSDVLKSQKYSKNTEPHQTRSPTKNDEPTASEVLK